MKSTSSKPDPRAALDGVLANRRCIFLNTEAVREAVVALEQKLLTRAMCAEYAGGSTTYPEGWPVARHRLFVNDVDPQAASLRGALNILENSPEYIEAAAEIRPLLAAAAELEQREAEAALAKADMQRAHRELVAAAEDRAREAALNSPEIAASARRLAAA